MSNSLQPHRLYVAYQAPLSMGFSRQEYWSGLPFPSPGDLPGSRVEPGSPALQADSLLTDPPENSQYSCLENPRDGGCTELDVTEVTQQQQQQFISVQLLSRV